MNRGRSIAPVLATLLLLSGASASGRTWQVRLEGTGDFTDIQPAVEASASGDTISIGPGRFDTFHSCVAPAWTEETVVWANRDNLTFIGAGRELTIIGPAAYYCPYGAHTKGICSIDGYRGTIENLTVENTKEALYWWRGSLQMRNCRLRANDSNFVAMLIWPYGATIRDCVVETTTGGRGGVIGMMSSDVTFDGCQFIGNGNGITVTDGTQNVRFTGCTFINSMNGVHCDYASTVTISDSRFEWMQNGAVNVWNDSRAVVERVQINHAAYGLSAASGGTIVGSNIVVEATWYTGVLACCNAFVTIHNSHILPAMGFAVKCEGQWVHQQLPDLTGCYWGTTEVNNIRAAIWDAGDTFETNGVVNFEPFANGPVPTECTTWGDLKALFR